jgi:transposase-like protein
MRAADLFEQVSPPEIARQLGVCYQIVSDWRSAWRRSGRDGLRRAGRAGRLPKLSPEQLAQVESAAILLRHSECCSQWACSPKSPTAA